MKNSASFVYYAQNSLQYPEENVEDPIKYIYII